jgi:hypothetical protein
MFNAIWGRCLTRWLIWLDGLRWQLRICPVHLSMMMRMMMINHSTWC